jgi:iron complex outermembrane receptor protein
VFTLKVTNVGSIRSRGVELIGDYQLSSAWSLTASYTYTDAVITDNPTDPSLNGKRQPGAPKNAVSFGLQYRAPWGLSAVLRGRYLSKQFTDAANTLPLDANTVCDLYLAYRLTHNSEVFFLAQNLFDEEYLASSFGNQRGAPLQVLGGLRVGIL